MKNPSERLVDGVLQPLRISPGWLVEYNIFTEYDPVSEHMAYFWGSCLFAASNVSRGVAIELIYEPEGDPSGSYILDFFQASLKNQILIRQTQSRSRQEIVAAIENFMVYFE